MADKTQLKYTPEHEWLLIDGDTATVGITDYAAEKLGDVVFVDLPAVGASVAAGKVIGEIESTKSVGELFSPVDGNRDRGQRRRRRRSRADQHRPLRRGLAGQDHRLAARGPHRPDLPHLRRLLRAGRGIMVDSIAVTRPFEHRHIGTDAAAQRTMLDVLGYRTVEATRCGGGARLDPATAGWRCRQYPAAGGVGARHARRTARIRRAEHGQPVDDRPRLLRHHHAGGDQAQRAREPELVHRIHALPAGDLPGPARGADQLPDHGGRPHRPRHRERVDARREHRRRRGHAVGPTGLQVHLQRLRGGRRHPAADQGGARGPGGGAVASTW